ncbi:MAG: hypothetical protein B6I20_03985 [Bacteroidetes bacterium 4572_117]|nr:MAG: hypothetical protein B6I20_03985 [Bacteroidetes bacterium 4572_117]
MRHNVLLFFTLFFELVCHSQDFKLKKIDNQFFPTIKLTIELNSKENVNDIKIIENGQETAYRIDTATTKKSNKAICYLIDIELFSYDEKQVVVDALFELMNKLPQATLINICFVSNKDGEMCFVPFSYEFTDEHTKFVEFVKNRIQSNTAEQVIDNLAKISELIKTTRNDFFINIEVISAPKDSSLTMHDDFLYINTELTQQNLANKLYNASIEKDLTNIDQSKNYVIEFITKQKGTLNYFEIFYKNENLKGTFILPRNNLSVNATNWILGLFGLFSLVLLLIIINLVYSKRKLSLTLQKLGNNKLSVPKEIGNGQVSKRNLIPSIEIKLDATKTSYKLKKLVTTIGRKKKCDILIDNLTVSSHHASITNEGGEFYIQDHDSTNGVFVNDVKVSKTNIKSGDTIRLGKAILIIHY